MSDFQDWKTVVIKGKSVPGKDTTNSQSSGKPYVADAKFQTLDSDDPDPRKIVGSISIDMRLQIQKARNNKGLSQKQLAQQLNIKPDIINQYESGKIKPDNRILQKMGNILGVKFTTKK